MRKQVYNYGHLIATNISKLFVLKYYRKILSIMPTSAPYHSNICKNDFNLTQSPMNLNHGTLTCLSPPSSSFFTTTWVLTLLFYPSTQIHI